MKDFCFVFDVKTESFSLFKDPIICIDATEDFFVAASSGRKVILHNRKQKEIELNSLGFGSIKICSDFIAVGSWDGTCYILDFDLLLKKSFRHHEESIDAIEYIQVKEGEIIKQKKNPINVLVLGSRDSKISFWDTPE